jgi:hypothetical protein
MTFIILKTISRAKRLIIIIIVFKIILTGIAMIILTGPAIIVISICPGTFDAEFVCQSKIWA